MISNRGALAKSMLLLALVAFHRTAHAGLLLNQNVILNPNAEAGLANWTASPNSPEVVAYGAPGFPTVLDPGPSDRGSYFFAGGPASDFSWLTQTLDVSDQAALIDAGLIYYTLSAWQGGKEDEPANASIGVSMYDVNGYFLFSNGTNYSNSAADRNNATGLYFHSAPQGLIVPGTRSVTFQILFSQGALPPDGYSDGYIDNVSFVAGTTAIPEPSTVLLIGVGLLLICAWKNLTLWRVVQCCVLALLPAAAAMAQDTPDLTFPGIRSGALYVPNDVQFWPNGARIPVCWMTATAESQGRLFDRQRQVVRDAVLASWPRHGNIQFSGFADCPVTGTERFVRVLVEMAPDGGSGGSANVGMAALKGPADDRSVHIVFPKQDDLAAKMPDSVVFRIQYLAVHEFGHVLGFVHEQDRGDNADPSNPVCNPKDSLAGRNLTWYDRASIMHYCSNRNTLSIGDKVGVGLLYYAPPAIANPLFGTRPDYWATYPSGFAVRTTPTGTITIIGPNGKPVIISNGVFELFEADGDGGVFQDVRVIPGRTYRISASARLIGTGATADARLWVHDTANKNIVQSEAYSGSSLRELVVYYTADSTGYVRVHLHRHNGAGTVGWRLPSISEAASNGEMESFPNTWSAPTSWHTTAGFNAIQTTQTYFAGSSSVALPDGEGYIYQDLAGLLPLANYTFSAMLSTTAGASAKGYLQVSNTAISAVTTDAVAPGPEWRRTSVIFKSDASGRASIRLGRTKGTGIVYFDSATLTPSPSNGGFEISVSDWNYNPPGLPVGVTSSAARDGLSGLLLYGGSGEVFSDVPVQQNALYRVSVWVRGDGTATPTLQVDDGAGGKAMRVTAQSPFSDWRQLTVTFTPGNSANMRIRLIRQDGSGSIYWDQVTVDYMGVLYLN